jgi:hypothetical protein
MASLTTASPNTTKIRPPVVPGMPLPELTSANYTFNATPDTTLPASIAFGSVGVVKVKSLVSRQLSLKALDVAQQALNELFSAMKERGVALEQGTKGGYAEIVQRSEGRYEMNYKMTQDLFANSEFTDNVWLNEFVSNVMGGTASDGSWALHRRSLLISFPGAKEQQWHVDGGHRTTSFHSSAHALNAFVALGDISIDMGPTEIRPCSHYLSRKLFKFMMLARARKQLHSPVQPVASSGDAIIFDYRTLHRGTANNSDKPRAMLELVFFKKGFTDILNFPKRSIFDVNRESKDSGNRDEDDKDDKDNKDDKDDKDDKDTNKKDTNKKDTNKDKDTIKDTDMDTIKDI